MSNVKNAQRLESFVRLLELQIEDRALNEVGIRIQTFFDASDLRDTVLGMQGYYSRSLGLDRRKFENRAALVHCLAAAGWLGPLEMLPPHQDEFLHGLDLRFGQPEEQVDPEKLAGDFLKSLRLDKDLETLRKISGSNRGELLEIVREKVGSAADLFKAVSSVAGTWETRLTDWRDRGQIIFGSHEVDLGSILRSHAFIMLREAFGRRRPSLSINNLADTLALGIFCELLEKFRSGASESLPIFFCSSSMFHQSVVEAELEEEFSYSSRVTEKLVSTLRGVDYFIYRAIVNPVGPSSTALSSEELGGLLERVQALALASQSLEDVLEEMEKEGPHVEDLLRQWEELSFFENIWLPASSSEFTAATKALERATQVFQSQEFRRGVEAAIEETKARLEESASAYRWALQLWTRLEKAVVGLKQRSALSGNRFDPFLDYGLLRFSLPPESEYGLRIIMRVLAEGDQKAERDALVRTLDLAYSARHREIKSADAGVLAGVLWCLGLDAEVIAAFSKLESSPHVSVDFIQAAAHFRNGAEIQRGLLLLTRLETVYASTDPDSAGGIALEIGLAYLSFHAYLASRRQQGTFLENAIQYARLASERRIEDRATHLYSLNQYLYYLVEADRREFEEEMRRAADGMVQASMEILNWQYRFDDTLARYFLRLSEHTLGETKKMLLEQAISYCDKAMERSLEDLEVAAFKSRLLIEYAQSQKA
jgi:hypothetical protein